MWERRPSKRSTILEGVAPSPTASERLTGAERNTLLPVEDGRAGYGGVQWASLCCPSLLPAHLPKRKAGCQHHPPSMSGTACIVSASVPRSAALQWGLRWSSTASGCVMNSSLRSGGPASTCSRGATAASGS